MQQEKIVALAVGAHPDDIEFLMAGTLLLLKNTGAEIHLWNMARGDCGSDTLDAEEIARVRFEEAQASADVAGATLHPPVTDDIAVLYEPSLIKKAAAVVRTVKPALILVPSLEDYMEDHQNAARLVVTGAFIRGARNFVSSPPVEEWNGPTAIYHAMPYGLRNCMRQLVRPGQYVDIGSVMEMKRSMLSKHSSQREWLDYSQGIGEYLSKMESLSRWAGTLSGRFEYAEGWRPHLHLGFCPPDYDPLSELLATFCWTDPDYEASLG